MIKKNQNYRKLKNKKSNRNLNKKAFYLKRKSLIFQSCLYIQSTRNNLILSLTDANGNVVLRSSSGIIGINGSKKRLFSNRLKIVERILSFLQKAGTQKVSLIFRGFGKDRELVCRNLQKTKLTILNIKDYGTIAHNGCRIKKPKRL